jgi:PAS domain S-box-containing protein
MSVAPPSPRPRGGPYLAVFLALVAAIAVGARVTYTTQRQQFERELRSTLDQLAALKATQVADWRRERFGDARVAVASARLMPGVAQVLAGRAAPQAETGVTAWLEAIRVHYNYANVLLTDTSGQVRLTAGELLASPEFYVALAADVRQSPDVLLTDVPRSPAVRRSHFALGLTVTSDAGAGIGTVLVGIDPSPLVQSVLVWPSPSETADLLLVRRDGDDVLYLAAPRTHPDADMTRREPLSSVDSPAGRAVLGTMGAVDTVDTTGARTVASAAQVAGSSWVVVATIADDEAWAPFRALTARLIPISVVLVLMSAGVVVLTWRYQVSTFERQRAEAERERRALIGHYEVLTRFGNDAILLLDGDGGILEANDRAVEWFLYPREQLIGMHVQSLRESRARQDFDATWSEIKRQKRIVYETTGLRRDGSVFPVEVSARVMDIDGADYVQTIVRDITERRQAEAQIRRLNRLYAVLSECGRVIIRSRSEQELFGDVVRTAVEQGQLLLAAIATVDERGMPTVVSRAGAGAAYLDRTPLLPADETRLDLVRRDRPVISNRVVDDPRLLPWRTEAFRAGVRASIVLPLRQGARTVGLLGLFSSEQDFFTDAETDLAVEVASSVSYALEALERRRQQRESEESLRVSRDRLERVLDAVDEGYWDWNLVTGEMHLSPRYHTMLGYVPGELRPEWDFWLALAHPEDAPVAEAAFRPFISGRQNTFALEWRMRCKSGQYIWVLTRGKVEERDDRGVPTRLVGTHTDITDRKKLEEQYRQSQKLESVGRLAGGVAHDFNNLLTVINGYSEVVLGRMDIGDRNRRHLEAIQEAGERAAGLTGQLLAFSRKQAVKPRPMRLNGIVQQIEGLLRRLLPEHVSLGLTLGAVDDAVLGDASQLHQVVMNLVVNARDAMPAGGRLTLSTSVEELKSPEIPDAPASPHVVLSVSDTGVGMDEATRARIFEPFFTTKEPGRGTGLGLATVYGIVGQSGGFLRVESEPGAGSTFHVCLPQIAFDETTASPGAERPLRLVSRGETVLVAEDQQLVRELAAETLAGLGYQVLQAEDGASALDVAARHQGHIDLLLTDVMMPGVDGVELAQRLGVLRPDTRVLFTSGYTDDVLDAHRAVLKEAAMLPKPFTPAALALKVRDVLGPGVEAPPAGERRAVLVVDDDPRVRNLFPELLGGDFEVLIAADGREAIEIARRERRLDLLITDLFMPHHDGIETLQVIRERRPGIPVIAISGAFGGQFLKAAERFGVDATLQKPIQRDLLLGTIATVLARSLRPA